MITGTTTHPAHKGITHQSPGVRQELHDSSTEPWQPKHAQQDSQSTPIAVPYYPQLKPIAGSVLGALVLTYLEMRHPAPRESQTRRVSLPVTIDFDRMARELNVSRRTLGLCFVQVGRWYGSEFKRLAAVRAGREFLAHSGTRYKALKFYSIVSEHHFCRPQSLIGEITLRRNVPHLAQTLADTGLTDIATRPNVPIIAPALDQFAGDAPPPGGVSECFAEIILRGVELAQDRRHTRYTRLRNALENGLVDADALKVRRRPKTEAVDPDLSDAMKARMSAGKSRRSRD